MRNRYGIFIILLLFIVLGVGGSIITRFYSLDYLYNKFVKKEFVPNPRVSLNPEKEYLISLWYHPFLRTIKEGDAEKEFFRKVVKDINSEYPNITLKIRKLNFYDGHNQLVESLARGNPPDIYLNFTNDSLLHNYYQIPLEIYLNNDERSGFFTVDLEKGHLWGLPFLVQEQGWIANKKINGEQGFIDTINSLDKETLLLNYHDLTLLRQLLTLTGIEKLKIDDNGLSQESQQALKEVFNWLHYLKENQIFASSTTNMDEKILRMFFTSSPIVIGPINPWLDRYLYKHREKVYHKINMGNLIKVYTINVFRQRKYKGDDHTRAAVEVAKYIAKDHARELAPLLGLEPSYIEPVEKGQEVNTPDYKKLLEVTPEYRDYWDKVVIPVWFDFWEKGLTPEEVMYRLRQGV